MNDALSCTTQNWPMAAVLITAIIAAVAVLWKLLDCVN